MVLGIYIVRSVAGVPRTAISVYIDSARARSSICSGSMSVGVGGENVPYSLFNV